SPPATRLGTTRCRSLVLDCPKHRVIMRGRSIPFPARPAKLARLPMLETVPRLADCNEAKLSNFNQCCFSAAQDRAARGWRKPLLNRQRGRHFDAERLCGLEVDRQLVLGRWSMGSSFDHRGRSNWLRLMTALVRYRIRLVAELNHRVRGFDAG